MQEAVVAEEAVCRVGADQQPIELLQKVLATRGDRRARNNEVKIQLTQ